MPSKMHQMLLGLIARKMKENGYEIVAYDGKEYLFDGKKLDTPPIIKRHKPDMIGFKFESREICIGEAKTKGDLSSKRTEEQLLDYSSIVGKSTGKPMEIILGIEKSAEGDLLRLLRKLNLNGNKYISYIWLPGVLVDND